MKWGEGIRGMLKGVFKLFSTTDVDYFFPVSNKCKQKIFKSTTILTEHIMSNYMGFRPFLALQAGVSPSPVKH